MGEGCLHQLSGFAADEIRSVTFALRLIDSPSFSVWLGEAPATPTLLLRYQRGFELVRYPSQRLSRPATAFGWGDGWRTLRIVLTATRLIAWLDGQLLLVSSLDRPLTHLGFRTEQGQLEVRDLATFGVNESELAQYGTLPVGWRAVGSGAFSESSAPVAQNDVAPAAEAEGSTSANEGTTRSAMPCRALGGTVSVAENAETVLVKTAGGLTKEKSLTVNCRQGLEIYARYSSVGGERMDFSANVVPPQSDLEELKDHFEGYRAFVGEGGALLVLLSPRVLLSFDRNELKDQFKVFFADLKPKQLEKSLLALAKSHGY